MGRPDRWVLPGGAARLVLADGRRAFCKAVSRALNTGSHDLCLREIHVNTLAPAGLPAPRLLDSAETDDGWVVLLFDDVEGHHPATPWTMPDAHLVLDALDQVATAGTPAPADLPHAIEPLEWDLTRWPEIAAAPPSSLDPWVEARLPLFVEAGTRAAALVREGDTLCQLDVRADNMLVDTAGRLWLIDWPWGCRGPAWLDVAFFGMFACLDADGSFDPDRLIDDAAARHGASSEQVTDVWAAELGYYVAVAETAPPPNLPTIRDFQRRMRDALPVRVRSRLEREGRDAPLTSRGTAPSQDDRRHPAAR